MAAYVLTVIGDDQPGLVDALSGVVADHGGNWDRSHMARLAGKFAGIVSVTIPDGSAEEFVADLGPLQQQGLLGMTVEPVSAASSTETDTHSVSLDVMGTDHPGIVHDISHALAEMGVGIVELETETRNAAMAGGMVFHASASLALPRELDTDDMITALEGLAGELMVDIEVVEDVDG